MEYNCCEFFAGVDHSIHFRWIFSSKEIEYAVIYAQLKIVQPGANQIGKFDQRAYTLELSLKLNGTNKIQKIKFLTVFRVYSINEIFHFEKNFKDNILVKWIIYSANWLKTLKLLVISYKMYEESNFYDIVFNINISISNFKNNTIFNDNLKN